MVSLSNHEEVRRASLHPWPVAAPLSYAQGFTIGDRIAAARGDGSRIQHQFWALTCSPKVPAV
jgi:hypothetical protein